MQRLGHLAELLPVAGGLCGGRTKGRGHLRGIQVQQLARGHRGAERPSSTSEMPTQVIVIRRHRQGDPSRDLVGESVRRNQRLATQLFPLAQRQRRCHDGTGGMQDGWDVGVIEVHDVGHDAVDQSSVGCGGLITMAQNGRLRMPSELPHHGQSHACRLAVSSANRDAEKVQDGPNALANNRRGKVIESEGRGKSCQPLGGSARLVHGDIISDREAKSAPRRRMKYMQSLLGPRVAVE